MGRKRLDPNDRREFVGIRIPAWMLKKIKEKGTPQKIIEEILHTIFKKEK